ncbi:MAG: PDZ domain-containing protein [Acidimicrobiales bacterium]
MPTTSEVEARASRAVADRFADLLEIERQISDSSDGWASAVRDHPEAVELLERTRSMAESHREALERSREAQGRVERRQRAETQTGPQSASEALRRATEVLVAAALCCEVAYQTARLAYAVDACDLLESMLVDLAALVGDARRVLPHVVVRELRAAAITCVCRCPACSIGACGCIRATLATTEEAWGGEAPARESGLSLLSPPRPGSQLAEAGLEVGARILSVDGVGVGSNADLQAALRRHEVGEEALVDVERLGGEMTQLVVRRVG